jgi:hypothetical protein
MPNLFEFYTHDDSKKVIVNLDQVCAIENQSSSSATVLKMANGDTYRLENQASRLIDAIQPFFVRLESH